jgi:predicted nucleic acid-binding protein
MELNDILLDTSAYSALMRGHTEMADIVGSAKRLYLPIVVIGELLAGFERGAKREENLEDLDAFCDTPRVTTVPLTRTSAERYAIIYRHLRAAGTPVPTNDMWIASTATEHGAVIITLDRHFLLIPQVIAVVVGSNE